MRPDDDDDDRPRRRSRRRDEEEDDLVDDRPRGRSRGRDPNEDDYSDDMRPRRKSGGEGLGVSAMIVGIISLLLDLISPFGACICPFVLVGVILGFIGGVVAVVLGFMAWNRTKSGMGMAGIITG